MASDERDWWTKFDMVVKALSALLLPLVILLASQWYTAQQKQADNARLAQQKAADEAQHNTDRVTLLLTHLASENTRQRLLALKFIEYLAQSRQFPEPLLPALMSVVDDSDEAVAQAAAETLTQVLNLNPSMTKSVEESAQRNSQARKTLERAVQKSPSLGPLVNVHPAVNAKVPDSVRDSAPGTGKSAPTPLPRPTRRRIKNPNPGIGTSPPLLLYLPSFLSAFRFEIQDRVEDQEVAAQRPIRAPQRFDIFTKKKRGVPVKKTDFVYSEPSRKACYIPIDLGRCFYYHSPASQVQARLN